MAGEFSIVQIGDGWRILIGDGWRILIRTNRGWLWRKSGMAGDVQIGDGWRNLIRTNRGWLWRKSGMAGEFSASIGCIAMAYGLASQNSACQHALFLLLTCNDMQTFELDFISHPDLINGENDLGSFEIRMLDHWCWRSEDG